MGRNLSHLHLCMYTQTSILVKSHPQTHQCKHSLTLSCIFASFPVFISCSTSCSDTLEQTYSPILCTWGNQADLNLWHLAFRATKQEFPRSCSSLCDPVNSSPWKLGSRVRMMLTLILDGSETLRVIPCILIRRPVGIRYNKCMP